MAESINSVDIISDATVIKAGESKTSSVIALNKLAGAFSAYIRIAANSGGAVTAKYELSFDTDSGFVTPSDADDIFTLFSNDSGPNGSNHDLLSFSPHLAQYIRIVLSNPTDVDVTIERFYMGYQ